MLGICIHEHRDKRKLQTVINLSDVWFPCDFPLQLELKGTDSHVTSNQPKYLHFSPTSNGHFILAFKIGIKCGLQPVLKLLFPNRVGNEIHCKLLPSALFHKSLQLHLTVEWNLCSTRRTSQLLPSFQIVASVCTFTAIY